MLKYLKYSGERKNLTARTCLFFIFLEICADTDTLLKDPSDVATDGCWYQIYNRVTTLSLQRVLNNVLFGEKGSDFE